jgi:hypothetical protein
MVSVGKKSASGRVDLIPSRCFISSVVYPPNKAVSPFERIRPKPLSSIPVHKYFARVVFLLHVVCRGFLNVFQVEPFFYLFYFAGLNGKITLHKRDLFLVKVTVLRNQVEQAKRVSITSSTSRFAPLPSSTIFVRSRKWSFTLIPCVLQDSTARCIAMINFPNGHISIRLTMLLQTKFRPVPFVRFQYAAQ